MLEALRFTSQLFEHDPFARDLILAGRRTLRRRTSSSSLEPLQKKFKGSTENQISAGLSIQIHLSIFVLNAKIDFFMNEKSSDNSK